MPSVGLMLTLNVPEGAASSDAAEAMAFCSPARLSPIACKRSPASVRVRLRVLRWKSRMPRLASSTATLRLTAAGVTASRRAAAEKLPSSAVLTKDSRLITDSISSLSTIV